MSGVIARWSATLNADRLAAIHAWMLRGVVVLFALSGIAGVVANSPTPTWVGLAAMGCSSALALALTWTPVVRQPGWLIVSTLASVVAAIVALWAIPTPVIVLASLLPFAFLTGKKQPWWGWLLTGLALLWAPALIPSIPSPSDAWGMTDALIGTVLFGTQLLVVLSIQIGMLLVAQIDRYRSDQNDLALTRERLRFASELHDIQGHTLLAIKLKAELARRSLDRAPETTRRELADIEELVADVTRETRDLAHGYRRLTLAAELANMRELLTATGMRVDVDLKTHEPGRADPLLAVLAREATSNILKHADPKTVRVQADDRTITVTNDGVQNLPNSARGSGLIGLRQQFAEASGTVEWHHEGDTFTVTGTVGSDR